MGQEIVLQVSSNSNNDKRTHPSVNENLKKEKQILNRKGKKYYYTTSI